VDVGSFLHDARRWALTTAACFIGILGQLIVGTSLFLLKILIIVGLPAREKRRLTRGRPPLGRTEGLYAPPTRTAHFHPLSAKSQLRDRLMNLFTDYAPAPIEPPSMASSEQAARWTFERLEACPVCGSSEATTILRRTVQELALEFSRCRNCNLIYQNPRMTRDALASYFSSSVFICDPKGAESGELLGYPDYFDWDRTYQKTSTLRLARLAKFKQPPGELLEIGTATGSFLNAARSTGFRVRGLDLSSAFAGIARKRHSLDIDVNYVEEAQLPYSHYDVVCSFGGIACWRDPIRALTNVNRTLKADGIFVLNYFDVDSLPGKILGHRHFEYNHASLIIFSKSTMQHCLRQTGFDVIFSQNERQYASFGRIAGYIKSSLASRTLRALRVDNATIPMIVPGTIFAICRKQPV
jgi:SAM-dependent methyltransferase